MGQSAEGEGASNLDYIIVHASGHKDSKSPRTLFQLLYFCAFVLLCVCTFVLFCAFSHQNDDNILVRLYSPTVFPISLTTTPKTQVYVHAANIAFLKFPGTWYVHLISCVVKEGTY